MLLFPAGREVDLRTQRCNCGHVWNFIFRKNNDSRTLKSLCESKRVFRLKGSACFPSPLGLCRCKAPCLSGGTTASSSSSCSSCCTADYRWWSLPLTLSPAQHERGERLMKLHSETQLSSTSVTSQLTAFSNTALSVSVRHALENVPE